MDANEDVHTDLLHNSEASGKDSNKPISSNGDKSLNGPGPKSSGSKDAMASSSDNNVCRDYMRNVCTRGKKCKYTHPEKEESSAASTLLQDSIVFCHDFQNRNDCSRRQHCRFIHCRKEEEEEFKRSGFLPPHIRDQAITKAKPYCKDFMKGNCNRGRNCKFRHISERESLRDYEMERSNYLKSSSSFYPDEYDDYARNDRYDMPPMKRRRPEYPDMGGGGHMGGYGDSVPHPRGGPPSHSLADMDMLQQENMLLKSRVEELKKQVQELTTTNNFLLEQNAHYRKGPQMAMAQPAVSMQPPISVDMPMATTSISMAQQQMGPQHDSARMVSYPGRL